MNRLLLHIALLLCALQVHGNDSIDVADRLTEVQRGGQTVMSIGYAGNGNITAKTDIGSYAYASAKPHAVTGVSNTAGLIPEREQDIAYNAFGKVSSITEDETAYTITYGPDRERWQTVLEYPDGTTRTTTYAGNYERIDSAGHGREFYFLDDGIILFRETGQQDRQLYAFRDNLGSYLKLYDEQGTAVFEAEYDAWGRQSVTQNTIAFHRGYTGHEHLPEFGLINMNGRMYDPLLGRFLSPDNYVQEPYNSQNFNRYAYCLNNPLKYVDPDGEWFLIDDLIACVVGGTVNLVSNLFSGKVKNFWHGLSLFAMGAVAGEASLYGGAFAGAAVLGAGNSIINQGFINGWNNISFTEVLGSTAFSLGTAYLGGEIGKVLQSPISNLTSNISNTVLKNAVTNTLTNSFTGFALGMGITYLNEGSLSAALEAGFDGFVQGAVIGAITGTAQGIVESRNYDPTSIEKGEYSVYQGVDPNTGEVKYVGITKRDPEVRWNEHYNSGTERAILKYEPIKQGLSKTQARTIEQQLIIKYGIQKKGGQLYNRINSIAPKYWEKYNIKYKY